MNADKGLNGETPQWFRDWHAYHYFPFRQEFKLYRALQWVILAAVIGAIVAACFGS